MFAFIIYILGVLNTLNQLESDKVVDWTDFNDVLVTVFVAFSWPLVAIYAAVVYSIRAVKWSYKTLTS